MANEVGFVRLMEQERERIIKMLPSYVTPDRWWGMALELERNPELADVARRNPRTLINAIVQVARWGLEFGEQVHLIPYGDVIDAQPNWKGLIYRSIEAGVAAHIFADVVCENDFFEAEFGTVRRITHKYPKLSKGTKRGEIVGAYAVATLANGIQDFEVFDLDDIARIKNAALRMAQRRKRDAGMSPAWRAFEGEMCKKSVIKRLCKRLQGKRDGEAADRLAAVLSAQSQYDTPADDDPIDVTQKLAAPYEHHDDTPTAEPDDGGETVIEDAPNGGSPPSATARARADEDTRKPRDSGQAAQAAVPLTDEEIAELDDAATAQFGSKRFRIVDQICRERFSVERLALLTRDKKSEFRRALKEYQAG